MYFFGALGKEFLFYRDSVSEKKLRYDYV